MVLHYVFGRLKYFLALSNYYPLLWISKFFSMKENDIYSELSSIRNLMERSTKFISLSGLSGIMAGIYALVGAFIGYKLVYKENTGLLYRDVYVNDPVVFYPQPVLYFMA